MSCGAGEFRVETDKFSIGPAVLLMVPPRAVHEFRFSENVEGYVVTARIERIEQMLNGCSGIRAFFNTARRACAGLQHVLSWIDREVGFHPTTRFMSTCFGWHIHVSRMTTRRTLQNFPMQAHCGEILRLSCNLTAEAGIEVCCPGT